MESRLLRAAIATRTAAAAASRAAAMASCSARAARNAPLASRTAAAAASRAAAMAFRSARATAAEAAASGVMAPRPTHTKPRDDGPPLRSSDYFTSDYYKRWPDDVKHPTAKDLESDEALWALYERWCKAHGKKYDHAEMACRFKSFKERVEYLHDCNTYVPSYPKEAAIHLQQREEVNSILGKGECIPVYYEHHVPMELGPFADEPITQEY